MGKTIHRSEQPKPLTDQATEVEQHMRAQLDPDKASDSSQSDQITTNLTKEQLTKQKNEYKHRQRLGVG